MRALRVGATGNRFAHCARRPWPAFSTSSRQPQPCRTPPMALSERLCASCWREAQHAGRLKLADLQKPEAGLRRRRSRARQSSELSSSIIRAMSISPVFFDPDSPAITGVMDPATLFVPSDPTCGEAAAGTHGRGLCPCASICDCALIQVQPLSRSRFPPPMAYYEILWAELGARRLHQGAPRRRRSRAWRRVSGANISIMRPSPTFMR